MGEVADIRYSQQRIEELEARVKWLEGALTSVLQERRQAAPGQKKAGDPFAFIEDDLAPAAEQLVKTLPMSEMLAAERQAAGTKGGAGPAGTDPLRFSSSFANLDERLREQLEQEAAAPRGADLAPPVTIDAALIDLAFARPAPELIEVRSALEDSYPHLLERITATWGQPEALRFLRRLIVDDRGSRQGFPFDVMSELLTLSSLAESPAEPMRLG